MPRHLQSRLLTLARKTQRGGLLRAFSSSSAASSAARVALLGERRERRGRAQTEEEFLRFFLLYLFSRSGAASPCWNLWMCSSLFRLCVLFVTLGNMTTALRMALPKLPLPPMLLSNEPGTWAYDTMSRRVRTEILGREVLEANAALLETMPDQ